MMRVLGYAVVAAVALGSHAALAQTKTAYQTGLEVAQKRGYDNAGCYAQVFVRHAVVVEKADGRRHWYAASTPAYNADQRSRCGIDRLAFFRSEPSPSTPSRAQGGAYGTGLLIASHRGYSGGAAICFARIFKTHAVYRPSPLRAGAVNWSADLGPAMKGEVFSQCGISV